MVTLARIRPEFKAAEWPIETVLGLLERVSREGAGWVACCPAHDDEHPSLRVDEGEDGKVLLTCRSQKCELDDICQALGLRVGELFPDRSQAGQKCPRDIDLPPAAGRTPRRATYGEVAATYDYCDRDGGLVFQVVRHAEKRFRQRRPDGRGGWANNVNGVTRVPYRLPDLLAAAAGATVFVCEGEKDADALARLGLIATTNPMGAGNWKLLDEAATAEALNGKGVVIVPDNDGPGGAHAEDVARRLHGVAAEVRVLELSGLKEGGDVSDWLDAGGTREALVRLAAETPVWATEPVAAPVDGSAVTISADIKPGPCPYFEKNGSTVRTSFGLNGPVSIPIANFTARIVEQVEYDDGVERHRSLAVEGRLATGAALPRVHVAAADFAAMSWVLDSWGTAAVVYAGMGTRDHVRCAIQMLSGTVSSRTVFRHLGWRRIDSDWVYLHAGGAVGINGPVDVAIDVPEALANFVLPVPPEGDALVAAVRASLNFTTLGPERLTIPLLAAAYRSVIGDADFAVHVTGATGTYKSEVAALVQQHFGPGLDARHLPGGWSSTGNALEGLAFACKDAILVVDDFAPQGSSYDVQRYHREADRLLRGQGNHAGRQRMRSDGSLRAGKPPRGLVLSTGEDTPHGQSLRARLLILNVEPGDLGPQPPKSNAGLTRCQRDAADGLYAAALAAFARWLAPRYENVRNRWQTERDALRERARQYGQHARTPGIVADLALALHLALDFAVDAGAISAADRAELWNRSWAALLEAAAAQAGEIEPEEPAGRFVALFRSALASGFAHVANGDGGEPAGAIRWGWRDGLANGVRVGWLDGEGQLYLEPDAVYAVVQRLAAQQGVSLPVSQIVLRRRLRERGFLASTDEARGKITIRRTLQGERRNVLHMRLPDEPISDHLAPPKTGPCGPRIDPPDPCGPVDGAVVLPRAAVPAHDAAPETAPAICDEAVAGRLGRSGDGGETSSGAQRQGVELWL